MSSVKDFAEVVIDNVEKVIVGKRSVIELMVVAILCEGHVLLEDVPGVGKTMLARSLAASLGGVFRRIQFTPDLLPNDVTGVSVYNQRSQEFEFRPGPAFANVLLADEVNRATPRTQSSLLECMGEHQISVDGVTRTLPRPFLVLATQNPVEFEGTFTLPEAQLDRFLMRLSIGYPNFEDERQIIANLEHGHPVERLGKVADASDVISIQESIADVHVDDSLRDYVVRLVRATRSHADIALGASPRGTLALFKTSQALAAIHNRDYVIPDDIKYLAPFTLAHRLIVKPESQLRGRTGTQVLRDMLKELDVPVATAGR
ncbi:MAG TPA: MoxR family ATPase [Chloroflexota bacterium]|nr:MoxR family ATPase [Chloroflexota bacterium]